MPPRTPEQNEPRPATPRLRKGFALFAYILLAFSPLLFIGAGGLYRTACNRVETWTKAEATITALVAESSSTDSTVYYPRFEFLAADGQRYSVQSNHGSSPPAYEKGARVPILYSEASPNNAVIHSFGSLYFAPMVLAIMGLGDFFLGCILLYASRRKDLRVVSHPQQEEA